MLLKQEMNPKIQMNCNDMTRYRCFAIAQHDNLSLLKNSV
jgi:hypothetical protein